jgi:hypothetical protein
MGEKRKIQVSVNDAGLELQRLFVVLLNDLEHAVHDVRSQLVLDAHLLHFLLDTLSLPANQLHLSVPPDLEHHLENRCCRILFQQLLGRKTQLLQ